MGGCRCFATSIWLSHEGESIAVIGPNGAGKSTLLKCLVGLVRPAAGRVRWFGEATTRRDLCADKLALLGRNVGFMPN